jgi:hypothetical protein
MTPLCKVDVTLPWGFEEPRGCAVPVVVSMSKKEFDRLKKLQRRFALR